MKSTISVAFVGLLLWTCFAFALDRYVLHPVWPWASQAATIKLQFKWPLGYLNFPRIGLLILLGIPFLALAICCLPRRAVATKTAWLAGFQLWSRSLTWLLIWVGLTVLGQIFYILLQDKLPNGLTKLAESFEVDGAIKIFAFDAGGLKGSLTAVVGLVIGAYFFVTKGIRDTLAMVFSKPESKTP